VNVSSRSLKIVHAYILLLATISALYYALLYLFITCSPHLYTTGANNDDDVVRHTSANNLKQACSADSGLLGH